MNDVLELNAIKHEIASRCAFSLGKQIIEETEPSQSMLKISLDLKRCNQAIRALNSYGDLPMNGVHDIRSSVSASMKNATLNPMELIRCTTLMHTCRLIQNHMKGVETEKDLLSFASMIVDNMHAEAMVRVRVGYGNRVNNLQDIAKSYQEAKMALEVGRIFYVEKEIVAYSLLGIGRLIYQIPMSLCEMFIQEVFGDEIPDIFDEETMTTIQKFFDNNLNISETARQLYVHRNTLVYRLERLERTIGLDIRKFDDAMTFKIALMVISHMNHQKKER